ncbi:phosphotriesterase family protein [Steroidobacter cummioxidans]|uniref:phosphotriesterase family protein n=1 Tax=Steroidobacter cummioxidans TaxID=1803913 RepID=UPI000E311585|nr:TatD family hydrolase [Steroidobacter cummioxidans]
MTNRREFLTQAAAGVLAVSSAKSIGVSKANRSPSGTDSQPAGTVQTVLGPIDASKLGFTLTHEHVGNENSMKVYGGRENCVAKAIEKLKEARDAGIDTVVDVTTFDIGRDIRFREEISRESGMQIIACTGQHMFAPEALSARSVEEISELFVREIERGIDGTDIKPGVIKVASRAGTLTFAEENVFKAAARASKATGVPISTHTNSRLRAGEKQVEIFEAEGLSPSRVSLGHSDGTDNMEYLTGLLKRGYTLGMDHTFWGMAPGEKFPWQRRAECIKELIEAGFADRLFFSNDWVLGDIAREKINPDGMLFTVRRTIPYLEQVGVAKRDIHTITVKNPARFFVREA